MAATDDTEARLRRLLKSAGFSLWINSPSFPGAGMTLDVTCDGWAAKAGNRTLSRWGGHGGDVVHGSRESLCAAFVREFGGGHVVSQDRRASCFVPRQEELALWAEALC